MTRFSESRGRGQGHHLDAVERLRFNHAVGGDAISENAMPRMPTIVLDTLGKLYAHGHGLYGRCLDWSARYRPSAPAAEQPRAGFVVDIAALIAERGADAMIVGLRSPPCPRCGSARFEIRLRVLGE